MLLVVYNCSRIHSLRLSSGCVMQCGAAQLDTTTGSSTRRLPGMEDPGMEDPGMEDPGMEDPGIVPPGMGFGEGPGGGGNQW